MKRKPLAEGSDGPAFVECFHLACMQQDIPREDYLPEIGRLLMANEKTRYGPRESVSSMDEAVWEPSESLTSSPCKDLPELLRDMMAEELPSSP